MMRMEKEKVPETWNRLRMGGINNISCQHLQVLVTNLLQKHWEWQEERPPMLKHGSSVYGKLGHQDSFRRGEAEAYCENHGESQHTQMADRGPLS